MKRLFFTLFVMCLTIMAHAQATSLTVDCQNPGWLSSLIKYGDQQTVKNLKVTGYLNATDINFIGTLNESRDLTGRLDLSEVNMVGTSVGSYTNYADGEFSGAMFNTDKRLSSRPKHLSCLILPKNGVKYSYCSSFWTKDSLIDTLVFAPANINYLKHGMLDSHFKNLVLGENIDSICKQAFDFQDHVALQNIHLSSKTKYIGERAFFDIAKLESVNWNDFKDNLEFIGYDAFVGTNWRPDTLSLPNNPIFNTWNRDLFEYKNGECVLVGENIKKLTGSVKSSLLVHFKSKIPPTNETPSPNNDYIGGFKTDGTIIFVPYGCKDIYEEWGSYSYTYKGNEHHYHLTVVEEDPIHVDSVVVAEKEVTLNKIGETYQLHPIIYPTNAEIRDLTYTSSNSAVCVVRNDGLVTATGDGKCTIVVSAVDGGLPGICRITVNEETTGISNVEANTEVAPVEIYSVDGQKLSKLTKGINIIKKKGQPTKKLLVK